MHLHFEDHHVDISIQAERWGGRGEWREDLELHKGD